MMKLIPPYVNDNIASNAEKKIFNIFQNLNYDGTVFHSLGLASHKSKVYGEIDFVLVCKEGILCLEIKGGLVHRENGIWYFTDRFGNEGKSYEGPFNQVIASMFSLREYLREKLGYNDPLYKCQYACGVVFPDTVFKQQGPEIINDIIYDARCTDEEMKSFIEKCFKYWRDRCIEKNGLQGDRLSMQSISKAEVFLRGNFGVIPSLNIMLDETDQQIVVTTEEQYTYLEMLNENPRIIVKGGAGTGKTLLAVEHARRMALCQKKILYICFNRFLAGYLRNSFLIHNPNLIDNVDIVHFHGLLASITGTPERDDFTDSEEYYQQIMPERFLDYVSNHGLDNKFQYDLLLIDEGQDLLRINYMLCLNELLKGRLQHGNWCIFLDHNQNIYNKQLEAGLAEINSLSPVNLKLNTNCRNTKQIGIFNTLLSGIRHEKYLKVNGDNVTRESYLNYDDERKKLIAKVKNLKSQGVFMGDIVILSPYTLEKSCFQGENIFKGICPFQDITGLSQNYLINESIKFSTIHSFKGMESKIVIMIDMDKFDDDQRKYLHYIGISRARVLLHLFYKESERVKMEELMKTGFLLMSEYG